MIVPLNRNMTCPSVINLVLCFFVANQLAIGQTQPDRTSQVLTDKQLSLLLDSVQKVVSQRYYDKETASVVNARILKEIKAKKYFQLHRDSLLSAINYDLKAASGDGHLYVQSMATNQNVAFDWDTFERQQEVRYNFGFTEIQILEGNIGYLKITEFMHPKRSMPTVVAAMKFVESTKALIIDLRGNGGGYPGIMEYILNHYFDGEPVELSKTITANGKYVTTYTSDLIYGKLRINTPLYVLIDKKTASAAEYFAYTLQAFEKAIIVGEKSAGGANRNEYFALPFGFRLSVSVASPLSAATGTNWEGTGVQPDVVTNNPKEKAIALFQTAAAGK